MPSYSPEKITLKQQTPPFITPSRFALKQRLAEGIGIICLALALFLILAFLSYQSAPPSWVNTHSNIGGQVGHYLATYLLFAFGPLAYLCPLLLIFIALLSFKSRTKERSPDYLVALFQILGFFIVLITACGLYTSFEDGFPEHSTHQGGWIGMHTALSLSYFFHTIGARILLISLLLAGTTLATGLSWLGIIDRLGWISLSLLYSIWKPIQYLKNSLLFCVRWLQPSTRKFKKKISSSEVIIASSLTAKPILLAQAKSDLNIHKQKIMHTHAFPSSIPLSLDLLDPPESVAHLAYEPVELETLSREVEKKLQDFGIEVRVVTVHPGPVITRFEMQLAPGIKASRITTLAKDLARSLSVISVRIVEIIPGKSVVGLELPNKQRQIVRLSEVLGSLQYKQARSPLSLALGKDIAGHPVVVDLAKMPHLLTAGTTGSGKSVGLNAMLLSIVYKSTPEQVRLIMIDPKMLELAIYEGIPHLLTPVVTDMKEAASALRWCVAEMERRYQLMAALGVRNLANYNQQVQTYTEKGQSLKNPLSPPGSDTPDLAPLPYILVLIDEFADLMMVVGKKIEELIARIAQKARAAGIHLILATQRPSVDVITGLIKANIPTRIAFQVSSRIDSRTILDQQGAEQLLGYGDMLYLAPGIGVPVRIHGAFVADHEVHCVVDALKQAGPPDYELSITEGIHNGGSEQLNHSGEQDPLYDQAVQIVLETRRASISGVQRRLKIGYNRAARLIEDMETAGLVSPMESNGNREVLVPEGEER